MDLRDFEPARADRRLSDDAGRPPGLHHRLLFAGVFAQLGLMSLAWSLVARVLSLVLPKAAAGRLGRAAVSFIYRRCWATAEAFGLMRIDARELDALVVVARLPRGVCVMKAMLLRNVFLGSGARLAQYIKNDVGRGMVRDAVATLREGNQLVLFPEGTRTIGAAVNAFKPGISLISHLAQVSIQTVVIESQSPYLAKGWPLLQAPPVPVRIRLRLGRRFAPDADHRAQLRRLEIYFSEELRR